MLAVIPRDPHRKLLIELIDRRSGMFRDESILHESKESLYSTLALRLVGFVVHHDAAEIENDTLQSCFVLVFGFVFW